MSSGLSVFLPNHKSVTKRGVRSQKSVGTDRILHVIGQKRMVREQPDGLHVIDAWHEDPEILLHGFAEIIVSASRENFVNFSFVSPGCDHDIPREHPSRVGGHLGTFMLTYAVGCTFVPTRPTCSSLVDAACALEGQDEHKRRSFSVSAQANRWRWTGGMQVVA